MIDWDRMRELRRDIGPENLDEVVVMFFDEADKSFASLCSPLGAQALASVLHALKGASLNLGFDRLAALCRHNEALAAHGEEEDIDFDGLRQAYDELRCAFRDGSAANFAA